MKGKERAKLISRLAVFMVVPALGIGAGAQAGEQTAAESEPAERGVPFAQFGAAGPMGPYGSAPGQAGPEGMPPYGAGPHSGGPAFGYGPPGPGGMMGPGMAGPGMMGPGMAGPGTMQGQGGPWGPMRGGRGFGMRSIVQALHLPDLSKEQRDKLQNMAQEFRKKHWDLKGSMMEASDKLAKLWSADPVDANAIGEAYGALFDLQRQQIVSGIEARQQVEDVLTDEQKQRMDGGPAMSGTPFPMMMPPGMMYRMPGAPGAAPSAPGAEMQAPEASGSGAQAPETTAPEGGTPPTKK